MAIVRQSIEIEIKCCLPVVADVVVADVVASKRVVVAAFATAFDMCADRFFRFFWPGLACVRSIEIVI